MKERKVSSELHTGSSTTHDVASQDLIGVLLRDDLDHAIRVGVGLGARVRDHGKGADVVLDALSLAVLLSLADPCHLGVGVDDPVAVEES